MPRFLALDWDAGQAYVLAASVAKGAVKLEKAISWPEEHPPAGATAGAFGHRLKDRLKEAGVAPAPLLVAVSRDRFVVKDVKFPAVPPHEEPAIVRFQAMKEMTDGGDTVVIDYFTADTPEPSGERKAFVVALKKEHLTAYKAVAHGAGLKLAGVTPRAFGAVAALRRTANPAPEPGTAFAVLVAGPKGGEFVVARGEQIALARQISAAARGSDTALVGEIRRNLAVYAGQAGPAPVRAVYVAEAAGTTAGVADRLRDTLAVPVYAFDPTAGLGVADGPANLTAAAGLFHLMARPGGLPLDFVHPREPKPPRDSNRRAMGWAAAIAAAILLGLGGWGYTRLAAKDKELKDLRAEKQDLEEALQALEKDEKRIKFLDDWLKTDVCWLDELYDLTARFPDTQRLRLTQVNLKPSGLTGRRGNFVGLMDLKGLVQTDTKPLAALRTELDKDGFYAVRETPTQPNMSFGSSRMQFPQQWTTAIGVEKRPPEKYERKLAVAAPEKKAAEADEKAGDALDIGPGGAP